MQIAVLGATRPIGAHAIVKALDKGHTVVALVRKGQDALPNTVKDHPKAEQLLKVITGDATNRDNMVEATKGTEAVLNFLGSRGALKTTVTADATKILVDILPKSTKIVMVSNIGLGESRKHQNFFIKHLLLDPFMKELCEDKRISENLLAESGFEKWCAIRAGWLSDKKENVDKVKFLDEKQAQLYHKVSREDIAAVALKMIEGDYGDEYWGKAVNLVSG